MCEEPDRLTSSVAEAAGALGISRSYCYELIQEGRLPYLQLGRRRLVPRAALEHYVKGRTHATQTGIDASIGRTTADLPTHRSESPSG
jgi:excisionase family DNA binding protein